MFALNHSAHKLYICDLFFKIYINLERFILILKNIIWSFQYEDIKKLIVGIGLSMGFVVNYKENLHL